MTGSASRATRRAARCIGVVSSAASGWRPVALATVVPLLFVVAWTAPLDGAEQPLNVVVILADDLGWSDLACYGGDLHETPHLDRLAGQGVRFANAYAASVCSLNELIRI